MKFEKEHGREAALEYIRETFSNKFLRLGTKLLTASIAVQDHTMDLPFLKLNGSSEIKRNFHLEM